MGEVHRIEETRVALRTISIDLIEETRSLKYNNVRSLAHKAIKKAYRMGYNDGIEHVQQQNNT